MRPANELPIKRLWEVFDVNFSKGVLFWKKAVSRHAKVGCIVGVKRPTGHLFVQLDYKNIAIHRIIWAMHHGEWPNGMIDHINNNPADNRIENMRLADKSQNAANSPNPRKNNKTGLKGVSFHKKTGKFRASICENGKAAHLGLFLTPEEAFKAYVAASQRIHGEFSPYLEGGL